MCVRKRRRKKRRIIHTYGTLGAVFSTVAALALAASTLTHSMAGTDLISLGVQKKISHYTSTLSTNKNQETLH